MKMFVLLTFLSLVCIPGYSQRMVEEEGQEELSLMRYEGQRYANCQARIFLQEQDSINLALRPEEEQEGIPFELYIKLAKKDSLLSEGLYLFDSQKESPENSVGDPFFVRIYKEWGNAIRICQIRRASLYIQPFEENYLVSGWAELDTKKRERVEFLHYGPIAEEQIEVKSIKVYKTEDYTNNQGKMQWAEKTIDTPCAFEERKRGRRKIRITDKILFMDKKLEYGVSFEFSPGTQLTSEVFKSDDPSNPLKATFFNQGYTEYPATSELSLKYNRKKNEFTLDYRLIFPNNHFLTGSYKGKIPEDEFD